MVFGTDLYESIIHCLSEILISLRVLCFYLLNLAALPPNPLTSQHQGLGVPTLVPQNDGVCAPELQVRLRALRIEHHLLRSAGPLQSHSWLPLTLGSESA